MRPYSVLALAGLINLALSLGSCGPQPKPAETQVTAPTAAEPIAIPQVQDSSTAWTAQAHHVEVLTPVGAEVTTKASLAVAWTAERLLLQVHTDDADAEENVTEAWKSDSVEIFLASSFGSDDRVQFICNPGRLSEPYKPIFEVHDKRSLKAAVVALEMKTEKEGGGYVMTISVPWTNLKHVPQAGDVIGLQVYVNDAHVNGPMSHRIWYPVEGASDDPSRMHHVRLAKEASLPENAAAWLETRGLKETLRVSALASENGKNVELWSGAERIATVLLEAGGPDGSTAAIPLPEKWSAQKGAPLVVTLDGATLPEGLTLPDLEAKRSEFLRHLPLAADHAIFDRAAFPPIDFRNRDLVETALGPYELHTRFFDANWNEVTTPKEPGRYGARVEIKTEDGATSFIRRLTLFKTPQPYSRAQQPYAATVKFPAAFGLPETLDAQQMTEASDWTSGTLQEADGESDDWAILVAGLHEISADPARCRGFSVWAINNEWWSELEKRLGENQDYPHLTYLPEGYDKDQAAWPLILFLHGSGERGTDLDRLNNQGPLGYVHDGHPLPFIVITPQCPENEWWAPARLARLIDQVEATSRVDPKRIYVTGLSMGGYGSFDLGATYPDRIAAIAPLSGGEDPALAERLRKMPTWIFHGADDDVVPPRESVDLAHAMEKLGAPVKLTVYPGVGHGGWDVTYRNPELYSWFLQQSK